MRLRGQSDEGLARLRMFDAQGALEGLEQVMDDLRRNCQQLGLPVRSMEAEFGPSQCEFTFDPASPLLRAKAAPTPLDAPVINTVFPLKYAALRSAGSRSRSR